ncbi:MAG: hypothetical protein MUD12_06230 [Spirochaetes bacterium]|nr:hypothetical protein [Spirochaetota bacterium]
MKRSIFVFSMIVMFLAMNVTGKEIPVPDSKYLVSRTLSFSYAIGEAKLKFFDDNSYRIEYGSEGWYWYNEGEYKYKDGKIYLHPQKCLHHEKGPAMPCGDTMGEAVCSLHESIGSLYFTHCLKVSSVSKRSVFTQDPKGGGSYIEFEIQESKVREGSKRFIGNVQVIVMGMKNGTTTDNVKIRKRPSVDSESVKYRAGLFGDDAREYDSVPKNTDVTVIARTLEKTKVGNWNNFWYYVRAGAGDGVWMYGEFLKIK